MNYTFVPSYKSEEEIVNLLVRKRDDEHRHNDLHLFQNVIYPPLDDERDNYIGFFVSTHVLRKELKLKEGGLQPGDIDIMIIPYSTQLVYFNRTATIEVKIVRPTRNRPNKDADKSGIKQIKGLITDGFPLIGLMHVCMPEPLKDAEKRKTTFYESALEPKKPNEDNVGVAVKFDHFPLFSSENQMKRLLVMGFPKFVGLKCVGLNFTSDGQYVISEPTFNHRYDSGFYNPRVKPETLELVKQFFLNNPKRFEQHEIRGWREEDD
jgi:hypothetical protein